MQCGKTFAKSLLTTPNCPECKGLMKDSVALPTQNPLANRQKLSSDNSSQFIKDTLKLEGDNVITPIAKGVHALCDRLDRGGTLPTQMREIMNNQTTSFATMLGYKASVESDPMGALHKAGRCIPCTKRACTDPDCGLCHLPHGEEPREAWDLLRGKRQRSNDEQRNKASTHRRLLQSGIC